ncbi:hypothetical protein OAD01_00235 [Candidatus Marinimicrobia bacterium]|nr:hypothetical protein [Candidatus Neomarinimicrobiota bacterium]|tara:strand:+ start:4907 stop:5059 length:153 start_codon:yes stop_codon:yes gene_type:complete
MPRGSTSQKSVPLNGETSTDHFHPHLYVAFPIVIFGSSTISNLPFSKFLI